MANILTITEIVVDFMRHNSYIVYDRCFLSLRYHSDTVEHVLPFNDKKGYVKERGSIV